MKKYREVFKVDESVDTDKMEDFKKNSMQMMQYLKRAVTQLSIQTKQMNVISNARDMGNKGQTKML